MHDEELEELFGRLPRAKLALLPTPLQDCPILSRELGGVRILVKRDDLTGLGLGGNKTRGLEFIIGEALAQGADTLITWGLAAAPANHCRLTAAAAARAGMKCLVLLGGPGYSPRRANAFLCRLVGADLRFTPAEETAELRQASQEIMADLRSSGSRPYLVDAQHCFYGGLASLGYAHCVLELRRQFRAWGITPNYIYACSEGGTQAGLVLGKKLLDAPFQVVGIAPTPPVPGRRSDMARWTEEGAQRLGVRVSLTETDILNDERYAGDGEGTLTDSCAAALQLVAETEAIVLDPVYTGKAMAGLIDHIRDGRIAPGQTVVFVHTGGTPVIFDYVDEAGRLHSLAGRAGYM